MNLSHRLKQDILNFLSDCAFEKSEFKEIYHGFIQQYSEYRSKKYYPKIYQTIRELEELKIFFIDRSGCTYKYSMIRNNQISLNLIDDIYDKDSLQKQLLSDYHKVNSEVHKVQAELEIFNKYVSLYPKIEEKISSFTTERNQNLLRLESKLSAIDIILENI